MLNIIYILNGDWATDHRQPQMQAMTEFCNLTCIETPLTLNTIIRNPREFPKWFKNGLKSRQMERNLQIFKPIAFVPHSVAETFPILGIINKFILCRFINKKIKPYLKHPLILILAHPMHRNFIGLFNEKLLCYEITDAYDRITNFNSRKNYKIGKLEETLLSQSDIVFASSKGLVEAKQHLKRNIHFIPNAADFDFFHQSMNPKIQVSPDLAAIPKPRVGLIGHITENVDLEIIMAMAEGHPEWSVILIGRIKGSRRFKKGRLLSKVLYLPNVYYLGFKDYEMLPMYLKGIDVCLLPYKLNEFNKYVYPNKIHQYLAGGKPVVSTDLPEIRPFASLIFIAKNKEEFIEGVYKTLMDKGSSDHLIQKRLQTARENSVEIRAKQRIDLLEEALRNKLGNL
jgi:glycosyltransferase involved in cell wall biosynthesis